MLEGRNIFRDLLFTVALVGLLRNFIKPSLHANHTINKSTTVKSERTQRLQEADQRTQKLADQIETVTHQLALTPGTDLLQQELTQIRKQYKHATTPVTFLLGPFSAFYPTVKERNIENQLRDISYKLNQIIWEQHGDRSPLSPGELLIRADHIAQLTLAQLIALNQQLLHLPR